MRRGTRRRGGADADLRGLFATARPADGLEDRLVGAFRRGAAWRPSRLRIGFHPAIRRAAIGVAAALMLGGFGYVATQAVSNGGLPTPWTSSRLKSASNLREIGQGIAMSANENKGTFSRTYFKQLAGKEVAVDRQPASTPQEMARHFNESASNRWREAAPTGGAEFQPAMSGGRGWRDSTYNGRATAAAPADQLDSILLPTDDPKGGDAPAGKKEKEEVLRQAVQRSR